MAGKSKAETCSMRKGASPGFVLHDRDIREPLFDYLELCYGKVRVIEEIQMGRSRADVLMVTEEALTGIEIKSDADSYARLAGQVRDYDRFFDRNMLVVGSRHAAHVRDHVPKWWGILSAELISGKMDFYLLQEPQRNPGDVRKRKISLLWRPELAHIQKLRGMPRYPGKSKDFVIGKILEASAGEDPEILDRQISEELFQRDYTTIEEEIETYRNRRRR